MLKRTLQTLVGLGLGSLLWSGCSGGEHGGPPARPPETPTSLVAVVEEVKPQRLAAKVNLSGMVLPTEEGAVNVTAPQDGVVVRPLVRVGDFVRRDAPLAELNTVFGQTSAQVLDKLENLQNACMEAQKALVAAQTSLAQARVTLGQAKAAASTARSAMTQASAEMNTARIDLGRKQRLLEAGVFAQADVDEANNRFKKAEAAYRDGENQLHIAEQNIPVNQAAVAEFERAVTFQRSEVAVTRQTYQRNQAMLLSAQVVGSDVPGHLAQGLHFEGALPEDAHKAAHFEIRSPITGIVTDILMTAGQKITNGTSVATVTDVHRVYVDANAFEVDVAALHEGDELECTSLAYPSKRFKGRVKYLGRRVAADTRAIQVRSLIENPEGLLRPSMFVDTTVQLPEREGVLLVPEKAILTLGDQQFVMVQKGPDQFERRQVELGVHNAGQVEVRAGIKAGEKVVTRGNLLIDSRGSAEK